MLAAQALRRKGKVRPVDELKEDGLLFVQTIKALQGHALRDGDFRITKRKPFYSHDKDGSKKILCRKFRRAITSRIVFALPLEVFMSKLFDFRIFFQIIVEGLVQILLVPYGRDALAPSRRFTHWPMFPRWGCESRPRPPRCWREIRRRTCRRRPGSFA